MPEFDATTKTKIAALRARRAAGETIEVYEMVQVVWPSPDGSIYYAATQVDEVASVAPPVSPIEVRVIPGNNPNWFLPLEVSSSIGDEEVDLTFFDADEVISTLINTHGEGVKAIFHYWFPQETLLLEMWHGHLEYGEEEDVERITLKAVQGFRSADANVPGRGHYQHCSAVFGALLATQAEINEHDCPYNKHIGGAVGINNPATSQPWTFCDRRLQASCTARGINPLFHLSHNTIRTTNLNTQPGGGPQLTITSHGNETNLKEPVRVVMGSRRLYDMKVINFSRPSFGPTGWFFAMYEGCEGPIQSFSSSQITVGSKTQNAVALHYNPRLGAKGQTSAGSDLSPHGYSGLAHFRYNFGHIDPTDLGPGDASASSHVDGLNNIRVYAVDEESEETAYIYTEQYTTNRVWHIARMLCDKRWGYGLDYARLNKASWIAAAAWVEESVRFTDIDGNQWDHIRGESNVELIGKKVQQQIEDMCMAGRLSRPFLFDGEIHIVPLRELTEEELDDCPVFTDEGNDRNIVWTGRPGDEDHRTTLKIGKRKSVKELINRVECTIDDMANSYLQTPLRPVEDVDAQLKAGRLVGDMSRKVNNKQYPLLGVVGEGQGNKMAVSLLDLGPHDEGGLQNNLPITFTIWFPDALDLHQDKVIKVVSSRLTKYGFTYFRVKKIERQDDLHYQLECQAYNETYMDGFETTVPPVEPTFCELDTDCPPGFVCESGECVPQPPICRAGFGAIAYDGQVLTIEEPIC